MIWRDMKAAAVLVCGALVLRLRIGGENKTDVPFALAALSDP